MVYEIQLEIKFPMVTEYSNTLQMGSNDPVFDQKKAHLFLFTKMVFYLKFNYINLFE